jgi:hypothetical protein
MSWFIRLVVGFGACFILFGLFLLPARTSVTKSEVSTSTTRLPVVVDAKSTFQTTQEIVTTLPLDVTTVQTREVNVTEVQKIFQSADCSGDSLETFSWGKFGLRKNCSSDLAPASSIRRDYFLSYHQSGGWNNQKVSFAEAVMMGQCLNRTVVVYDGEYRATGQLSPLSSKVDVEKFSRLIHPVMELSQFLKSSHSTSGRPFPFLQVSHAGYYGMTMQYFQTHFPGLFSGHRHMGSISKPMDCNFYRDLSKPFASSTMIGFDSLFGDFALNVCEFQTVHGKIHEMWNSQIRNSAKRFVEKFFGNKPFVAVHLRRKTGWENHCKGGFYFQV